MPQPSSSLESASTSHLKIESGNECRCHFDNSAGLIVQAIDLEPARVGPATFNGRLTVNNSE